LLVRNLMGMVCYICIPFMKRILLPLIILGIGFGSCNKEPQPLSKEEIKQKIDSITSIRMKESDAQFHGFILQAALPI